MRKRFASLLLTLLLIVSLIPGCAQSETELDFSVETTQDSETTLHKETTSEATTSATEEITVSTTVPVTTEQTSPATAPETQAASFDASTIPAFSGKAYIPVNNNIPFFTEADLTSTSYEYYSPLDSLGRCGVAHASVGQDIMPTEERGPIGMIKPAGWHTVKYDCVDGKYLYNRCHLIGFQLTGENANEKNLTTGTRYLNIQGMLPFENMTADYVKETGNHVMYRVTPVYDGNNLLCSGVLMEGYSVEDQGDGICFCVFAYNAQPGVVIDYATGDSYSEEGPVESTTEATVAPETSESDQDTETADTGVDYVLNTNTMKFHYPDCPSVAQMSDKNKEYYHGSREDLIEEGYEPCKRCNP